MGGALAAALGNTIRLSDVTLGYDGHPAVHHLTGTFAAGSLTAVAGPNGSGKSTLLKGIMGTLRPLGGRIERPAGPIAYLPQRAELDRDFPATVGELVGLGLWGKRGTFGGFSAADREQVTAAISAVGLAGFLRRPIDTLSGGQLQRALFARVLVQDAPVILLDEPFAAIDESTVSSLMVLVERWHGEGRTVIAVLHDLDLIRRHFPQTLLLAREPVAWTTSASALRAENLAKARAMPEAWDEAAPWHEEHGHAHRHDHQEAAP
jgi:zinc/manganese transport system ATP-binding protein